jgi:hypothetical protein
MKIAKVTAEAENILCFVVAYLWAILFRLH